MFLTINYNLLRLGISSSGGCVIREEECLGLTLGRFFEVCESFLLVFKEGFEIIIKDTLGVLCETSDWDSNGEGLLGFVMSSFTFRGITFVFEVQV